ncbi:MAG: hypothetical protein JRN62_10110 [Nitrososphaerota archaeon]|jgi:hypothetical protein|nr:hypothetical protein [Nitrososphaerota archaeon]MDG6949818.1 hypothetical protein [Nitrososphaerota archaeon]
MTMWIEFYTDDSHPWTPWVLMVKDGRFTCSIRFEELKGVLSGAGFAIVKKRGEQG